MGEVGVAAWKVVRGGTRVPTLSICLPASLPAYLLSEKAKTTAWLLSRDTYIHAASDTCGRMGRWKGIESIKIEGW